MTLHQTSRTVQLNGTSNYIRTFRKPLQVMETTTYIPTFMQTSTLQTDTIFTSDVIKPFEEESLLEASTPLP